MNKKAEQYLFRKSKVSRDLLLSKKFYEEQIAKEIRYIEKDMDGIVGPFIQGLHAGIIIGHKSAARDCKRILKQILKKEIEKEKWKQRYKELNRYVQLNYKDYL